MKMIALVVAQTTDRPVWVLAAATITLAIATAVLAGATIRALIQLDEVKRDRHVEVFSEMGLRWSSAEMTEALQMEYRQDSDSLLELFEIAGFDFHLRNALERRRQLRAQEDKVILFARAELLRRGRHHRRGGRPRRRPHR